MGNVLVKVFTDEYGVERGIPVLAKSAVHTVPYRKGTLPPYLLCKVPQVHRRAR